MRSMRAFGAGVCTIVLIAAACTSFSSTDDATDAGADAATEAASDGPPNPPPPPGSVDSCDLPDASAPLPTCGDTQSSDSNCGACGHVCGTAIPCSATHCAIERLSAGGATRLLTLADGDLYGVAFDGSGATIFRTPADGSGPRISFASYPPEQANTMWGGGANGVAVGVYLAGLDVFALDGGHVASAQVSTYGVYFAAIGKGAYFFGNNVGERVDYATLDAGFDATPKTFFDDGVGALSGLVVDGDDLFIGEDPVPGPPDAGDGGDGRIVQKNIDTGNVTRSAQLGSPRGLATYGASIYWYDAFDRTIRAAPRAALGSPPKLIASLAGLSDLPADAFNVAGVAVDDASVYFILQRGDASSWIVQASRCGLGNVPPRVIEADYGAVGLAVDATYLYWGDNLGLVRTAK